MKILLSILSILSIVVLAGCAAVPPRPADIARGDYASVQEYVKKLIRHEMDKNAVAGLSIAVVDDQQIVWAEGFGYADREREIPATAETLYRVGSITKLFTATAAMQLAEQGRLDIDRPLKDYLPDFTIRSRFPGAAPITPRQLMTHHAGLPRDRAKGFMNPDPRPFDLLTEDIRDDDLAYPPGQVFSYSNLGVTLLGGAIQRVSGRPYAEHMRQSVLAPLGMANSSFDTGLSPSPFMARGYRGKDAAAEPPLRDVPAGGLNTNVIDLSRFISMVFAGGSSGSHRVLQPQSLAEMLRPQNADVPLDLNFHIGLGWMLSILGASAIENAGPEAHHSGATAFFRSQLRILPEHKLGIVVVANSSTAGQVVDHVATEALALALEAKTGIRQPKRDKPRFRDEPLPAATVEDVIGAYTTLAGFARLYANGNVLRADAVGHTFNLIPRSDGLLGLDYTLLGIVRLDLGSLGELGFSRQRVGGHDLLIARIGSQEMAVGERIERPVDLGAWRHRLGDYQINNLDRDHEFVEHIRLIEEDGFLLVEMTMAGPPEQTLCLPLMPLSDGEALLLSGLATGGETVRRVVVDGEERLAISGYLLKRVAP